MRSGFRVKNSCNDIPLIKFRKKITYEPVWFCPVLQQTPVRVSPTWQEIGSGSRTCPEHWTIGTHFPPWGHFFNPDSFALSDQLVSRAHRHINNNILNFVADISLRTKEEIYFNNLLIKIYSRHKFTFFLFSYLYKNKITYH